MRSLIVVRCGDQSLHLNWCVPRQDRTYDVAVSYFGNYPDRWIETCDILKKGRFSPVVTWLDGAVVLREHLGADSEEFGTDCP